MTVALKLEGKEFGRWTVLRRVENNKYGRSMWLCRCECGEEVVVDGGSLTKGATKSCGCYRYEIVKTLHRTHGMSYSQEYNSYNAMKQRCYYIKNKAYKYYGGLGVSVCSRWLESFENFYEDMGDKPSPTHSIDRIDCFGNYEPGNCKWSTQEEQANNKRKNKE